MGDFHFRDWVGHGKVSSTGIPITETPHYGLAQRVINDGGKIDGIHNTPEFAAYEVYAAHENGCIGNGHSRDPVQVAHNFSEALQEFRADGQLPNGWQDGLALTNQGFADGSTHNVQILDGAHRVAFAVALRNAANFLGSSIRGIVANGPHLSHPPPSDWPLIDSHDHVMGIGTSINHSDHDNFRVGESAIHADFQ